MMEKERAKHFDAGLLDLFFGAFDDVLAIRRAADTANAEQTLARALASVTVRANSHLASARTYRVSRTSRTLETSSVGEKGLPRKATSGSSNASSGSLA